PAIATAASQRRAFHRAAPAVRTRRPAAGLRLAGRTDQPLARATARLHRRYSMASRLAGTLGWRPAADAARWQPAAPVRRHLRYSLAGACASGWRTYPPARAQALPLPQTAAAGVGHPAVAARGIAAAVARR